MATLDDYLREKRAAIDLRDTRAAAGEAGPVPLAAKVSVEGRSGVRRIRIREHQVISDSPPDFAGYNLGPSSPELQLGVLGSCVSHIVLIQAARLGVPLESVEVEVHGQIDPRAGLPGFEHLPVAPHDLGYTLHLRSPADGDTIAKLFEAVERACPILNLLRHPQPIDARVVHERTTAHGRAA